VRGFSLAHTRRVPQFVSRACAHFRAKNHGKLLEIMTSALYIME
jgi:hypothetical protein